ncbi:MAG: hypothetical protein IPH95_16130 [Candidatus Promineofilum sp.]|nr:hypothetical protein [Promineifilum sp.]
MARLVTGDNNGVSDIFVRRLSANQTLRGRRGALPKPRRTASAFPAPSLDGRYVALRRRSRQPRSRRS